MAKKKELTQEQIDRKELIAYFASICSCEINYPSIQSMLKQIMKDEYEKYTYKGLQYALWYAKERKHMDISSIYIATYVYNEAKKYYQWQQKMKQQISDWKQDDKEVVVCKKPREEEVFD